MACFKQYLIFLATITDRPIILAKYYKCVPKRNRRFLVN
uniref:Uncharacterized protein n=1 Tax=Arundo donax TaxID=35708 RepID=A0A0A8ZXD1_ARUDO